MEHDGDCYLCDKAVSSEQASVVIPRLSLKVHLSCYEQDTGTASAPTVKDDRPPLRIVRTRPSAEP